MFAKDMQQGKKAAKCYPNLSLHPKMSDNGSFLILTQAWWVSTKFHVGYCEQQFIQVPRFCWIMNSHSVCHLIPAFCCANIIVGCRAYIICPPKEMHSQTQTDRQRLVAQHMLEVNSHLKISLFYCTISPAGCNY